MPVPDAADNPIQHCMFNLTHVRRVSSESKLPGCREDVQVQAEKAHFKLKVVQKQAQKAPGKKNEKIVARLDEVNASVLAIRDSIATQVAPLADP